MNHAPRAWEVTIHRHAKPKDAYFIEGLPGIGNVGKVVVDYLIEQTKTKKLASLFSPSLPNSVFVNEDNQVSLPNIEVHYTTINGQDYLFMTGDVQPSDEVASYQFCEAVIDHAQQWDVKRIITLGGIGLQEEPERPIVYCTGNDKDFIARFTGKGASKEVYGKVGPIIGVSGLLLGIAQRVKLPAITLLAETLGHPMYLGLKGARVILELLTETLGIAVPLDDLDQEIADLDKEDDGDQGKHTKLESINRLKRYKDTNYIG
ncbi:PAC2 family protein [Candidatus Woesearchaeota archaeon]|nr:PAC2 family protein [Candidatus Woesearchaeota archaeon]